MQPAERKQLLSVLDELRGAIEDLLLAGLTAASKSTVERLDVTFKEASRLRLLRLGSTLRIANEEISRFTTGSSQFSARRLVFFLGRAWLLATSMSNAIRRGDDVVLSRLMATEPAQPAERVQAVVIGVSKRVVAGAFASFDFRLRAIDPSPPIRAGEAMIWSCVFPMRKDLELPAEAFLHLPQKQKFKPSILLEKRVVEFSKFGITQPATGPTRILLGEASQVRTADAYNDWATLWKWDRTAAEATLKSHRPTPLDLEIELQEEVFLDSWQPAGPPTASDAGYDALPLEAAHLPFEVRLDRGLSGVPLSKQMTALASKKHRPPLYGIAHYESCRLVLQPLTALNKDGPDYLTVAADKISQAELVKAMKFT